jgi:hypothetical protein
MPSQPSDAQSSSPRRSGAAENATFVDVYDVRNCRSPVHRGAIRFPFTPVLNPGGRVHNVELNPSATKVYGSIPLHEADITNLADPSTWTVRNFQCEVAAQVPSRSVCPRTALRYDRARPDLPTRAERHGLFDVECKSYPYGERSRVIAIAAR